MKNKIGSFFTNLSRKIFSAARSKVNDIIDELTPPEHSTQNSPKRRPDNSVVAEAMKQVKPINDSAIHT